MGIDFSAARRLAAAGVLGVCVGTASGQLPTDDYPVMGNLPVVPLEVYHLNPPGVTVETVAEGLDVVWSLEFARDGRLFLTEKAGRVRVIGVDGRSWDEQAVTAEGLTGALLGAQALIIPAQNDATDERLIELGQMWGLALTQFVARGGVIALFETQTTSNAGTYQLLEPSGLFIADGRSEIAAGTNVLVDLSDSVAARNTPMYPGSRTTVAFEDLASPGRVVVATPDGRPIVVHRYVTPQNQP